MTKMESTKAHFAAVHYEYTHELPYADRLKLRDILDSDHSWELIGRGMLGLDNSQLTSIGQACLRNLSPTEELLNKMDTANVRVIDLYQYLQQTNQWRALSVLKPLVEAGRVGFEENPSLGAIPGRQEHQQSLLTPTPSFMNIDEPTSQQPDLTVNLLLNDFNPATNNAQQQQQQNRQIKHHDPFGPKTATNNFQGPRCDSNSNEENMQPPVVMSDCHKTRLNREANNLSVKADKLSPRLSSKKPSFSDQDVMDNLRLMQQIKYDELKDASDNFSPANLLGTGGFATVYRGNWKGTDVAIKRLNVDLIDQALNELILLKRYCIDNILPIYAISLDGPRACLVYQYMSNGSLEDRLLCKNNSQPLTWHQRARISEGVAKSLSYLHTVNPEKPLVHGDVKSANILLDGQFVPKLGDFGLARQVMLSSQSSGQSGDIKDQLRTHTVVTSVNGTRPYLPPEYVKYKNLSPALDVYSYGIVLLEMATGRRAYDGKQPLVQSVQAEIKQAKSNTDSCLSGAILFSLRDPKVTSEDSREDIMLWHDLLLKLGLDCAHESKQKRPSIKLVLDRLSKYKSIYERDPAPAPNNNDANNHHLLVASNCMSGKSTPQNFTSAFSDQPTCFQQQQQQQQIAPLNNNGAPVVQPPVAQPVACQAFNSALMSFEDGDIEFPLEGQFYWRTSGQDCFIPDEPQLLEPQPLQPQQHQQQQQEQQQQQQQAAPQYYYQPEQQVQAMQNNQPEVVVCTPGVDNMLPLISELGLRDDD